ncbi:phosphotransferase [Peribacillus butanolivorans]|uniref:phosphotransferase enzyme family protein n=1 Tax=Peribacillus butanolivorans TaxID=421767 RepID=UPI00207D54BB|nr:phosphotransferase [Peribacillus butanolivorans]MCO0600688.1 phosphotransferase [Peribacillus butanolivorans]
MEAAVESIFTNEMVELAGHFFQVSAESPVKLGDAENYVFEVYRDGTPFILRLTHQSHRTKEQVLAELKWIEYLQNNGSNIPKVIPSTENNLVEIVTGLDGTNFYCCLFEKAPGARMKVTDENFNEHLFFEWGKTIGQLHKKTKSYKPGTEYKRLNWYEEELLNATLYHVDVPEQVIHQQELIIKKLNALPVHQDNFGLIHSDIHHGNFHYHEGKIFVFDFDDCSNHWFASDLAIPLYYFMWSLEREGVNDLDGYATEFMREFIKGYETENHLAPEDYETIPLFLKLRDLTLYSFFYKKYDLKKTDSQLNKTVQKIERRIKESRPIVHFDSNVIF